MKRYFKEDLNKNFFNEFSERINFSGIILTAVLSKDKFQNKYKGKLSEHRDSESLILNGVMVSLKTRDLPINLKVHEIVEVNGRKYKILDIKDHLEVTTIDLLDYGYTG